MQPHEQPYQPAPHGQPFQPTPHGQPFQPAPHQQPLPPFNVVNVHNHIQQPPPPAPMMVSGVPNNNGSIHIVHLVLTIFTCGAWAPIWIIHAIIMAATDRPQAVYPVPPPPMPPFPVMPPRPATDRNREAVAAVAHRNRLRDEARRLALTDPKTAVQLGIGRRDLPGRQYDDGGLIDINRVPAEIFTHFAGITAERAAHIVQVRGQVGGVFSSVEEMMALAELPPHLADEIKDYAITIRG